MRNFNVRWDFYVLIYNWRFSASTQKIEYSTGPATTRFVLAQNKYQRLQKKAEIKQRMKLLKRQKPHWYPNDSLTGMKCAQYMGLINCDRFDCVFVCTMDFFQ